MRRITAAVLAVCLLFLTGCGSKKDGTVKEGMYYEATGICPDAVLLTVNGREITADRYFYWLTYNCDWLEQSLAGEVDWSEDRDGQTLGDYVKKMTLEHVTLYAVVEEWAETYDASLSQEDRAAMEQEYQSLCEACGGEDAYLKVLAAMGADKALAQTYSEDIYLYSRLLDLFRTEGSPLAPESGELDAWISENALLTVEYLQFGSGATTDLAQQRRQAEAALSRLKASGDSKTEFAALGQENVQHGSLTFSPGESGMGSAFEGEAQALAEGECSQAPVETDQGICLLLRQAVDREQAAAVCFDQKLRKAADTARVECGSAYDSIDIQHFCAKMEELRQAGEAPASSGEPADSSSTPQEDGWK